MKASQSQPQKTDLLRFHNEFENFSVDTQDPYYGGTDDNFRYFFFFTTSLVLGFFGLRFWLKIFF